MPGWEIASMNGSNPIILENTNIIFRIIKLLDSSVRV